MPGRTMPPLPSTSRRSEYSDSSRDFRLRLSTDRLNSACFFGPVIFPSGKLSSITRAPSSSSMSAFGLKLRSPSFIRKPARSSFRRMWCSSARLPIARGSFCPELCVPFDVPFPLCVGVSTFDIPCSSNSKTPARSPIVQCPICRTIATRPAAFSPSLLSTSKIDLPVRSNPYALCQSTE